MSCINSASAEAEAKAPGQVQVDLQRGVRMQTLAFQVREAARGNIVDEQLKLSAEWAAVWQADTPSPVLVWPEGDEPPFHRPSADAMRRIPNTIRAATGA